jgi:hypothetical protein
VVRTSGRSDPWAPDSSRGSVLSFGRELNRTFDKASAERPDVWRNPDQGDDNPHDESPGHSDFTGQREFDQRFCRERSLRPTLPHRLIPPWDSTSRRGLRGGTLLRAKGCGVHEEWLQIRYRHRTRDDRSADCHSELAGELDALRASGPQALRHADCSTWRRSASS